MKTNEALDALFTEGALPAEADAAAITDAMRSDAAARARFDALALADRAMHDAEVGEFERALGRASFLSNLDAMLAEEQAGGDAPGEHVAPVVPLFGPRVRAAALAAGALVASGLAWSAWQGRAPAEGDGFQPRAAVVTPPEAPAGPPVEVFCVARGAEGEVSFTGREDAPMGALTCPLNAELKLAHGDPGGRVFVAMVGASEDGALHWYGPSPVAPEAVQARPSARALWGFGESIRLGVNHAPGVVRVHALFSSSPLDHARVKRLVEGVTARARFESDRLDVGEGVATSSVVFEVGEEVRR